MAPRTTTIFFDSPDFFAADLNNGGVRVGLKGRVAIETPPGHQDYAAAKSIRSDGDADEFITAMVQSGRIQLSSLAR